MPRIRKRPIVIFAEQWDGTPEGAERIISWVRLNDGIAEFAPHPGGDTIAIQTLEGVMYASPGWWVARGVENEFYPIKASVIDATYDVLED